MNLQALYKIADTTNTCLAKNTSEARGSPAAFRLLQREPVRFLIDAAPLPTAFT